MPTPHAALPTDANATAPGGERADVQGVFCRHCRSLICHTDVGWCHVDRHGIPTTGWLCTLPHMHLAEPSDASELAGSSDIMEQVGQLDELSA